MIITIRQRLPRLYAPTRIKFWSLRNGIGANMGVVFDIDTQVARLCRRVVCDDGWKWQLVNYRRDVDWDQFLTTDKEMLDEFGSELEFELA